MAVYVNDVTARTVDDRWCLLRPKRVQEMFNDCIGRVIMSITLAFSMSENGDIADGWGRWCKVRAAVLNDTHSNGTISLAAIQSKPITCLSNGPLNPKLAAIRSAWSSRTPSEISMTSWGTRWERERKRNNHQLKFDTKRMFVLKLRELQLSAGTQPNWNEKKTRAGEQWLSNYKAISKRSLIHRDRHTQER